MRKTQMNEFKLNRTDTQMSRTDGLVERLRASIADTQRKASAQTKVMTKI